MANKDKPHGFRAIKGPYRTRKYKLATANSAIGVGDLVVLTAAGTIDIAAASATQIVGVALESAAASSAKEILVSDHPDTIYEAQTDDGTTGLVAQTGMFQNANIVATASANGVSKMEIDENSGATSATLPLKVLRLHKAPDNAFGEFNRLEVVINNHVLKSTGVDGLTT